jgi:hypothetical protein
MSRDLKIGIFVFFLASIVFVAVALLAGPELDINSSVIHHGGGDGRYRLDVDTDEEEGVYRFSIIDTREGYTYVFNRDDADKIIPPADSPPEE